MNVFYDDGSVVEGPCRRSCCRMLTARCVCCGVSRTPGSRCSWARSCFRRPTSPASTSSSRCPSVPSQRPNRHFCIFCSTILLWMAIRYIVTEGNYHLFYHIPFLISFRLFSSLIYETVSRPLSDGPGAPNRQQRAAALRQRPPTKVNHWVFGARKYVYVSISSNFV